MPNALGGAMGDRRISFPLYLHITVLAVGLALATAGFLRAFAELIPGVWELVLLILAVLVVALVMARRIAAPLAQLEGEAEAVRRFDFSDHPVVRSRVREIAELGAAFDLMRDAVRRFLRINRRLAVETDFEALRPWLLDKLVDIAGARGGVLYLIDPATDALRACAFDVEGGRATPAPDLPPLHPGALPALLSSAAAIMQPLSGRLQTGELRTLGLDAGLSRLEVLALPLRDRSEQLLGMLLLFKDDVIDASVVAFIEAVAASAATSLETQELLRSQKALVEATIHMVANAIDAKSPYTGGHCSRVPELTFMLARAACAAQTGPFAGYTLDREQWEALQIAGWLHDCGKVVTPEYVVDKATKLETLHNRIHEVRMRFEVLKRDAEIAALKAVAAGEDPVAATRSLNDTLRQLDDDFAFVAACNEGGEFLAGEKADRLKGIAEYRWLRTLDDRIGISHEERERKSCTEAPALPVMEPLLADRPEHRITRGAKEKIAGDNPWGFRMNVPELLYNRGELYNLLVERGTLSEEERYKINEHIVQTVIMLSQLPFPKHMRQVPEIAGGHHEKMDGTGYPKRLTREELSPVARMMAIADIFEALTAIDRPYKKGKTLSDAIRIMSFMKKEGHIDPDLFDLFLRSGIYRRYAERFMKPEQIDAVDIAPYLAPPSAA